MTKIDTRLQNFPISFLSVPLGLSGLALATQKAESILKLPFEFSSYMTWVAILSFLVVLIIYLVKVFKYPEEAKSEFNNPIKINFYPIIAKVFLILSIIFLAIDLNISSFLWWIGTISQGIFVVVVISAWMQQTNFKIEHLNPAWFIPVVGCMIIPIAGSVHFSPELSWFFLSIGLFWWLTLSIIIIYRIIFHSPLPEKLVPTFFILFAPPVIGFISITKLLGELNILGNLLYYIGLFFFALILLQFRMFTKIKFYLSWWAYSFPLAALNVGTILMYAESGQEFFELLSWVIFGLLNLVILVLLSKTLLAILRNRICVED